VIISFTFTVLSLITIALARVLRIRRWYWLWLCCAVTSGILGSFLAQMGSASATSVNPETAALAGAGFGFFLGLIYGGLCLGLMSLFKKKDQPGSSGTPPAV
jgi:hypothetical protein